MKNSKILMKGMGTAENENRTLLVRSAITALRCQCLYPLGNAAAKVTQLIKKIYMIYIYILSQAQLPQCKYLNINS